MLQASFFEDESAITKRIVNVASVPQRSVFRYPGGKTWLVPHIRKWLCSLAESSSQLIEPFAGGAIVSLTAVAEGLVDRALLVELDEQVAAVWRAALSNDAEWLADKIRDFNLNKATLEQELLKEPCTIKESAFKTILRNRVYHGGILAPGSGLIKHGENGKGITSRWYPKTLRRRLLKIAAMRDRITFIEGDGMNVLRENATRKDTVYFIDPPYTASGKKAGARLYTYNQLNHEELFRICSSLAGDFLMTYDNADGVRELAKKFNFETQAIAMKNTHHAELNELLIGRNLSWVRSLRTD